MSWEIEVDSDRRMVRVRVTGLATDDEMLRADDQLRAHPDFEPGFGQLIDIRHATELKVTAAGIERLTQRPPLFAPDTLRAIVADSDLGFGLARMFELYRDGTAGEVRVFRKLEDAERWLEL